MKAWLQAGLVLLLTGTNASSNEELDTQAFAVMQECLASAEQSSNEQTGLDGYCIDSYLATKPKPEDTAN